MILKYTRHTQAYRLFAGGTPDYFPLLCYDVAFIDLFTSARRPYYHQGLWQIPHRDHSLPIQRAPDLHSIRYHLRGVHTI
jgi:hypothetical protein